MARGMVALGVVALGLVGALTGCTPTPTGGASTPASGSASTSASAAAPTTSPTPTAEAASCENLVDAATLTFFTTNSLAITPSAVFGAKMQAEGNYLGKFVDAGGVLCQVAGVGAVEARELYAWAPFVEADAIPIQNGLTGEGWTVGAASGGAFYSLAADSDNIIYRCLFTDTQMACALDDARLAEVLANAPS